MRVGSRSSAGDPYQPYGDRRWRGSWWRGSSFAVLWSDVTASIP